MTITPASPPELCPDCQRPFAQTQHEEAREEWCLYRESHGCRSRLIARLRLELSKAQIALGKAQGEAEGLRAGWSASNHEAWEQGAKLGWDCALGDMGDEEYQFPDVSTQNPFPKPEKKESE